jgi:hypothetical protein
VVVQKFSGGPCFFIAAGDCDAGIGDLQHFLTAAAYLSLRRSTAMSITSLASSILTAQAGNTQSKIATTVLKSQLDAEKNAVETILGIGQPSLGNVAPGIGSSVNETA